MTSKIILIIIILIIVIGGGFLWKAMQEDINEPSEQEEAKDEIENLLIGLEQAVGVDFSEINSAEIKWNVLRNEKTEALDISGKGFEIKGVSSQKHQEIESFFDDEDFEVDVYNVAAGTVGGLTGYKKDLIVCTVTGISQLDEAGMPLKENKVDVEVKCGEGDESIKPVISKEQAIKKLLADKYSKKVAEITINISQETDNHIRGSVEFVPGGPENSGLFLAAKVDDNWRLVFDGNGAISCEQLEKYDFPEEMSEDCSNIQTIETKKDDSFSVLLEANPTTGYQWGLDFDDDFIELTNRDYSISDPELLGSGGLETFDFKALKAGKTEINFFYSRPWESVNPIDEKVYKIIIK